MAVVELRGCGELGQAAKGEMKCLTEKEQQELGATGRGLWREQGRHS